MDDNMDIDHPKIWVGDKLNACASDFPSECNRVCDQTFTSPEQLVYKIVTDDKAFYSKEEVLILIKKLLKMVPTNNLSNTSIQPGSCSYIS